MKAYLKNLRHSPRKVRLVADLVKGKSVNQALVELDFLAKRASTPIKSLILSAVANAKQTGAEEENLFIKEIRVDKGLVLKRIRPAAMGSAHRMNKRMSKVAVVLGEKEGAVKKEKKGAKKAAAKK
jgi:large subunit ribosomal protein L22